MRTRPLFLLSVFVFSAPLVAQDNVLLLLADELGVDLVAAYGEHPDPAVTPNLDRLAANGVLVVSFFNWLPSRDPIARASEELVLEFNPQWQGAI